MQHNNQLGDPLRASMSNERSEGDEMRVLKRDGVIEIVSFDKILRRIKTIGQEVGIKINYTQLTMKVIDQLYDKISTTKIDELIAEGYDPKLDDGVGKNIAPLQKKDLLRAEVLKANQLTKYLNADW